MVRASGRLPLGFDLVNTGITAPPALSTLTMLPIFETKKPRAVALTCSPLPR
jgi:hypothetical protein